MKDYREQPKTDEHTFNIDAIELSSNIIEAVQTGNYLNCITDKGVKFRQHIQPGKRLNKKGDKYVLESVVVG